VRNLRAELKGKMEFVGVESEQTIEQELADAMEMLKDD
jgi:hypothetical protein